MELIDIYKSISSLKEYNEIFDRFDNNKEYIIKFLKMFLNDSTYDEILKSINKSSYNEAYFYSHTLKGIALNLGFNKLAKTCDKLCLYLKRQNIEINVINSLVHYISKNYYKAKECIENYFAYQQIKNY